MFYIILLYDANIFFFYVVTSFSVMGWAFITCLEMNTYWSISLYEQLCYKKILVLLFNRFIFVSTQLYMSESESYRKEYGRNIKMFSLRVPKHIFRLGDANTKIEDELDYC